MVELVPKMFGAHACKNYVFLILDFPVLRQGLDLCLFNARMVTWV